MVKVDFEKWGRRKKQQLCCKIYVGASKISFMLYYQYAHVSNAKSTVSSFDTQIMKEPLRAAFESCSKHHLFLM